TVGAERGITKVDALFVKVEQLLAIQFPDGEATPGLSRSRGEGGNKGEGGGDISEAVSAGAPYHGADRIGLVLVRRGSLGKREEQPARRVPDLDDWRGTARPHDAGNPPCVGTHGRAGH